MTNAPEVVASLLGDVWPLHPSGVQVLETAHDGAMVFAVRRMEDANDVIQIRAEDQEALVYVYDAGPIDFDVSDNEDRRLLMALFEALRDGRLRAVASLDSGGRALIERLEFLNPDGEVLDSLLLPVDVPRRQRRGRTLIAYEPLR